MSDIQAETFTFSVSVFVWQLGFVMDLLSCWPSGQLSIQYFSTGTMYRRLCAVD